LLLWLVRPKSNNYFVKLAPLTPKGEPAIWPNPVSNELHIDNGANSFFFVYDLLGKEVYKANILSDKESVHIEFLPSGVYVVQIVDPATGQRVVKKIVKE
jgi:hypothetical protein